MKHATAFFAGLAAFSSLANGLAIRSQGDILINPPENLVYRPEQLEGTNDNSLRARDPSHLVARDTYCNIPRQAGLMLVGGQKGGQFCETKWPGAVLPNSLTTYSNGNDITAIQVGYTDGTVKKWGGSINAENSGTIHLAPGERITSAWLAGNGVGTRFGKMNIVTSKGQNVFLGKSNAPNTYTMDVGSGLLIGVTGQAGDAIDALGLVFLKPKINQISIGNMVIDPNQLAAVQGQQATAAFVNQVHYYNGGSSGNQTWNFQNTHTVTKSTSFSQSTTGTFGDSIAISAEVSVPEIAKISVTNTISWSVAHTTASETTTTESYAPLMAQAGTLGPKQGVDCSGTMWSGQGTFTYTSTVSFHFDDGSTFSYPETGQLSTTQYSAGQSSCSTNNSPNVPSGYSSGNFN